jgi:uncharacterized protein (DUF58 family)
MNAPAVSRPVAADLGALMKIRSLELRAKVVVEGLWRGLHRSPVHGFSVEFTEYRPYSQGDDVRHLDWRLYARSDRDYIKKYEDETNLRCHLVVDQSRSMAFAAPPGGAAAVSKADYAATFAATWATFLFGQGDAVGLTRFAGGVVEHLPARNRPGHMHRLLAALERPSQGRQSNVPGALEEVANLVRRRGMLVLLSDLLVPLPACERPLAALRAAGHEVMVVQVLDPAERGLALAGPARLRDLESDRVLDVDPALVGADYRRDFAAHVAAIGAICARLGVEHHVVMTDQPLGDALARIITGRARRDLRARGAR